MKRFIKRQVEQIQQEGVAVLVRKIKLIFGQLPKLPFYILAIPAVLIMRIIKPWLLVRVGVLISTRIGHFVANTELYLCEQDAGINVPSSRHIDIFHMGYKPICNKQLATMWQRVLRIWPAWILGPINLINWLIPGGKSHEIGNNTQYDRDVNNLLNRFPPHLQFTTEEDKRGEAGLRSMGIPIGAPFVCLIVRDSAYLAAHLSDGDHNYHNYRDSDVQNYVLAAETLAEHGFFVIRMGVKVHAAINSAHPKVIDYAINGQRSDFMDIYLGAKCSFCLSNQTGWDAIPYVFRKPICYVNTVPIGYLMTFTKNVLFISKHHWIIDQQRRLTLKEIFTHGVGFCLKTNEYESNGIHLIENNPEEIRDVAIEMVKRLNGSWQPHEVDEELQHRFREIFLTYLVDFYQGTPLHGEIYGRVGAFFLRHNQRWLK